MSDNMRVPACWQWQRGGEPPPPPHFSLEPRDTRATGRGQAVLWGTAGAAAAAGDRQPGRPVRTGVLCALMQANFHRGVPGERRGVSFCGWCETTAAREAPIKAVVETLRALCVIFRISEDDQRGAFGQAARRSGAAPEFDFAL